MHLDLRLVQQILQETQEQGDVPHDPQQARADDLSRWLAENEKQCFQEVAKIYLHNIDQLIAEVHLDHQARANDQDHYS